MKTSKTRSIVFALVAALCVTAMSSTFAEEAKEAPKGEPKYAVWELKTWAFLFIPDEWTCSSKFFADVDATIEAKEKNKDISAEEAKTLKEKWAKHLATCKEKGHYKDTPPAS